MSSVSGSVSSRHRFGAIAVYYRGSLQYSIVQKLLLGKYFPYWPAFQRSLWQRVPHVSSLSSSVPSRHLFVAVPNYHRRSLQYCFQELLLGRSLSRVLPTPHEFCRGLVITELSLRPIVDCRFFSTRLTRMSAGCVIGVVQGR